MKVTAHLDHTSRCQTASGTSWSNRWTYRDLPWKVYQSLSNEIHQIIAAIELQVAAWTVREFDGVAASNDPKFHPNECL